VGDASFAGTTPVASLVVLPAKRTRTAHIQDTRNAPVGFLHTLISLRSLFYIFLGKLPLFFFFSPSPNLVSELLRISTGLPRKRKGSSSVIQQPCNWRKSGEMEPLPKIGKGWAAGRRKLRERRNDPIQTGILFVRTSTAVHPILLVATCGFGMNGFDQIYSLLVDCPF